MDKDVTMLLVGATIYATGAEETSCSECHATVWLSCGSLERAMTQQMPVICVDCCAKIKNSTFGGIMNRGNLLPPILSERLFEAFENYLRKRSI